MREVFLATLCRGAPTPPPRATAPSRTHPPLPYVIRRGFVKCANRSCTPVRDAGPRGSPPTIILCLRISTWIGGRGTLRPPMGRPWSHLPAVLSLTVCCCCSWFRGFRGFNWLRLSPPPKKRGSKHCARRRQVLTVQTRITT